ncbi:hypothetical protein L7F22_040443 [Adiantum nelumboides]|nr:hypothetical protein [Adiantum nelumboides]
MRTLMAPTNSNSSPSQEEDEKKKKKKKEVKKEGKAASHSRRDSHLRIEVEVQARWHAAHIFEVDAPPSLSLNPQKFFGNFTYPYMNGTLHIGHAFSFSKLMFASAYYRLRGRNVMVPFGFHCSGMPIKACADKLKREIEQFGNPPQFPADQEMKDVANQQPNAACRYTGLDMAAEAKSIDVGNYVPRANKKKGYKSKKSKAEAKSDGEAYQWQIMSSLGIPPEEIPSFRDPTYWLTYFPEIAMEDLKSLGAGIDWRRSFITTEMNPYYDSFVKWQFRALKKQGKVVKELRYSIYSPRDGQPCTDHDRATGEGVKPKDYTIIKLQVQPPLSGKLRALDGKSVFLAAATTRPEAMYGQTNAWVLPEGEYGAFEINETEVFIMTSRAAYNLAYQLLARVPEKPTCLLEMTGHDLIGLPLTTPLSNFKTVYALPLSTISTHKGTGIVPSVPSNSPHDYLALSELKNNPNARAMLGICDEWVLPYDLLPYADTPGIGNKPAESVCIDLKIKSLTDKTLLGRAKELLNYTDSIMVVGHYKGEKVDSAKPLVEQLLLESGLAVKYSEPKKRVTSRSGDECVVALTDQWYLVYDEAEWKSMAQVCLSAMELYGGETRHDFEHALGRLKGWPCSRSFGLGTRIPWDEQFLIDSLSDSTVYMAFYTVAHLLQGGDIYGQTGSGIRAEDLTDDVWDYILCDGPFPSTDIPESCLKQMKQEFEYWYPFDLRVSGKDLIRNHLTFCVYNHTALFAKEKWPKAFRCNGFLMLNSKKMSKRTGNFKTLRQAIAEYSADGTRLALADAGDYSDDANFSAVTANKGFRRLMQELTWMREMHASTCWREGPITLFVDKVFENEINTAIHSTERNYDSLLFREALKTGFYNLQSARDKYRVSCIELGMKRDLVYRYISVETQLLTPICPHFAEHVWSSILGRKGFAVLAKWPAAAPTDLTLQQANAYLQGTIAHFRKLLQKQVKTQKAAVFVAEMYEGWKEECLKVLQKMLDTSMKSFASYDEIMDAIEKSPAGVLGDIKQIKQTCSSFVKFKMDEALAMGLQALDVTLPFDEIYVLQENIDLIKRQLGLEELNVYSCTDEDALRSVGSLVSVLHQSPPSPGSPAAIFFPCARVHTQK